jgi:hypothetical protein
MRDVWVLEPETGGVTFGGADEVDDILDIVEFVIMRG